MVRVLGAWCGEAAKRGAMRRWRSRLIWTPWQNRWKLMSKSTALSRGMMDRDRMEGLCVVGLKEMQGRN